jgi:hypothetical protein
VKTTFAENLQLRTRKFYLDRPTASESSQSVTSITYPNF